MIFIALYGAVAVGMGVLNEQAGLFSLAHPPGSAWGVCCRDRGHARIAPPGWASSWEPFLLRSSPTRLARRYSGCVASTWQMPRSPFF